jgi:ferredoxin
MIRVNINKCIGCGVCANICPAGIVIENSVAVIKDQSAACLNEAVRACPTHALVVDTANNQEITTNRTTPVPKSSSGSQGSSYDQNRSFNNSAKGAAGGMGRGSSGWGRGRNQGRGLGLGGYCVCPNCGHKVPHQRGIPCYEIRCPKCNSVMTRM